MTIYLHIVRFKKIFLNIEKGTDNGIVPETGTSILRYIILLSLYHHNYVIIISSLDH